MNKDSAKTSRWSTSSFGGAPITSPMELAALGEHMNRCDHERGALFGLKCAGDAFNGFAAPRMITTLVVLATLGMIVSILA